MTDAQRRSAVLMLIGQHTAASTVSKKVARDTLIDEGIYTRKGQLRVEFGGIGRKTKAAA